MITARSAGDHARWFARGWAVRTPPSLRLRPPAFTSGERGLLAGSDPVLAASVQRTIGKTIFWIFAIVFILGGLVGLLIGFFVGRTVGRKQGPAGHEAGTGTDAGQLTG
ncbi:hypothetical protein [Actinomycetospora sp. TBRC 11914]|uniref:hypothetical protein n=1 Tax=Actinomycetospora sp. TBRC 11914 TaxID=2729387 RepID=UPI00145C5081|nr:hypothetical protein [Actinomycetospora sp. TBRC 11914]NMO90996.1 hypothetical protein [Actinomycetospora sp. TBRC 11914]